MDALRVKHAVNDVFACLVKRDGPADYAQLVRVFVRDVATLLFEGVAGYTRLNVPATGYDMLRTSDQFVGHAIFFLAKRWNADRKLPGGTVNVTLRVRELTVFTAARMADYEVYLRDHPEKVAAYARRYTTVDAILSANVDVEAIGEPYEMTPIPLPTGRVGCGSCTKTMASMAVLATHHAAIHQSQGKAACTECTWTSDDRPGLLADHQQTAHDIYPAGHPHAFTTSEGLLSRKPKDLLQRLLVEDRATLAALRGEQPPLAQVPADWERRWIAKAIASLRVKIKAIPGWEAVVDQKRARRVAQ